jgi:hypothetical protein
MWTTIKEAPKHKELVVKDRGGHMSVVRPECGAETAYDRDGDTVEVCPTHFFDFEANEAKLKEAIHLLMSLSSRIETIQACAVSELKSTQAMIDETREFVKKLMGVLA